MLVSGQLNLEFFPSTEHLPSPSPSHSSLTFFHGLPATACTPSPSDFNGRPPRGCFQPSPASSDFQTFDAADPQYMSGIVHQNPSIRIEESAPTPAHPMSATYPHHPADNAYTWGEGNGQMVATGIPNLRTPVFSRKSRSHQRAQSSSSIGSSGSSSPFSHSHATSFPYGIQESPTANTASKLSQAYNLDDSTSFGNHLPTPTQTPTQDSFIPTSYSGSHKFQPNQNLEPATAASVTMSRAMMDHQIGDDDVPGMSHSGRHSLSSLGQEPSTPHAAGGDAYEVGYKYSSTGETSLKVEDWIDKYLHFHDEQDAHNSSKLDHTMTESYADEGYYPATSAPIPTPTLKIPQNPTFLSPRQSQVREFLQAAQIARSQSPTSTISRDISPFRTNSPWAQSARLQTAAQTRENQKAVSLRNELSQHMSPQENNTPKTISPKDAVLEYRDDEEESKMPLFPDTASFGQQYGAQADPSTIRNHYDPNRQSLAGSMSASGATSWSPGASRPPPRANFSAGPLASTHQHSAFNFAVPSGIHYQQGPIPFSTQNYRTTSTMPLTKQEETPDFPAHLTSMESSASEAAPPSSNASAANNINVDVQRPASTSTLADTGTYTCTYHGCSLRFETPQKLQRHKREGHRQVAAQQQHTPGVGSGMTSAALSARNSQSGPHKCERINPTTGKPCNTVFSRPYDLTRHEDTIHNARKQKVRCALCVEEKTFSRNDALTRHMRVVHPEVDFPGKHRRRGAHE